MPTKKKKRNVSRRYRVTILNENTLDTIFTSRLTRWKIALLSIGVTGLLLLLFYIIFFATPVQRLLPGYLDPKLKQQIVTDVFRMDSLTAEMTKQEAYLQVVKGLMSGSYQMDTSFNLDTAAMQQMNLMDATSVELEYRRRYEQQERFNLSVFSSQVSTDGLLFYVPAKGSLMTRYNDLSSHFGVDIATASRQPVQSVLDGKVIFAGYTPDYGYVLMIQHNSDFLSIYREMGALLVKQGDEVKAGQVVAFVEPVGSKGEVPHLHFELWSKGVSLNPEEYILFQ